MSGLRAFQKSLPEKLRSIREKNKKCQNREYRNLLFRSKFFRNKRQDVIREAILKYNKGSFISGMTRQEAQYYHSFIQGKTIDNTQLGRSDHILAQKIKEENVAAIREVQLKIYDILNSNEDSEKKIAEIVSLVFQRQDQTDKLLRQGFIRLSVQNSELLEDNKELKAELEKYTDEVEKLTNKLKEILEQEALILERKNKRKNRKRLPPKEPLTEEIYNYLINEANLTYRETYVGARLRLALAILAVTGVRIGELLTIKVSQLKTLFTESWIAIDRSKRGPSNHKAFLTYKGKKIFSQRRRDFEIILFYKQDDSFIFLSLHLRILKTLYPAKLLIV